MGLYPYNYYITPDGQVINVHLLTGANMNDDNLTIPKSFEHSTWSHPPVNTEENHHDWIGTIKTNSGISFDMVNPTVDMVYFDDIANALSLICRYNGQIPSFYSVAEHSVRVAEWLLEKGCHQRVAFAGLLHDSAEAYIGDIVRPMKQIPSFKDVYGPIEEAVEIVVGKKFDIQIYPMFDIVHEADKAVYEWEVENIRSGKFMGMGPATAEYQFRKMFKALQFSYSPSNMDVGATRNFHDSEAPVVKDELPTEGFDNREVTAEYWNTHITSRFMDRMFLDDFVVDPWILETLSSLLSEKDVQTMTDLREIADRG